MPTIINGSVDAITFPDGTIQTTAATSPIPSGSVMLFYQSAAPTGWTQVTTQNNKALRVVSGTGGVAAGTTAFTTVFSNQTPTITTSGLSAGATTLTTSQIPSHSHLFNSQNRTAGGGGGYSLSATDDNGGTGLSGFNGVAINSTGGGGSHTHSVTGSATSSAITLNVQYIDIILASKN
jgi:hypothetical protein